jgi:hypothetical protein
MPAITTVAQFGPPIRWGNAAGKAIIAECWRIPTAGAGDTQTLISNNIAVLIGIIGAATHSAVTPSEAGVQVPITVAGAVAAGQFSEILLVGYARDAS